MTKANTTTDARVPVGIDISKNRHDVLIAVPAKTRRRRTVALARTREALHNSWDSPRDRGRSAAARSPMDDPKDAQVILHMPEIGAVQIFHDPLVAGTGDIQELSTTYEMVACAKTGLWHRILTHCLPLYFPEADRGVVQHCFGKQRLQLGLLVLQRLQPPRLRSLHAPEPGLPRVKRRAADPVAAANVRGLRPALLLPENRDDLPLRESRCLQTPLGTENTCPAGSFRRS